MKCLLYYNSVQNYIIWNTNTYIGIHLHRYYIYETYNKEGHGWLHCWVSGCQGHLRVCSTEAICWLRQIVRLIRQLCLSANKQWRRSSTHWSHTVVFVWPTSAEEVYRGWCQCCLFNSGCSHWQRSLLCQSNMSLIYSMVDLSCGASLRKCTIGRKLGLWNNFKSRVHSCQKAFS